MGPVLINPIPPRPHLGAEVYRSLRATVAELSLAVTTPVHLREIELAESLGVSRTPVREALRRLGQEGLVEMLPRRGVMVVPLTVQEYLYWLDVREMLEGMAARLAAQTANTAGIAKMRRLFDPFSAGGVDHDSEHYARANAEFHAALIGFAENPILKRVWLTYDHMAMIDLRLIDRVDRKEISLREHHAIIDALERRDPEMAERLARDHICSLKTSAKQRLSGANLKTGKWSK